MSDTDKGPDGRSTRWDRHRDSRRAELVVAAVKAIDEYGTDASVAEIAESAGVSKPVLYRYFTDKDDLNRAVGDWMAHQVLDLLVPILIDDAGVRDKIFRGADAYLRFVGDHPHAFMLMVEQRLTADPNISGKDEIAAAFTRVLGATLRAEKLDAGGAELWSYGMVGMGLSVAEWWVRRRTLGREATATYLASFIWQAFTGFAEASSDVPATSTPYNGPTPRLEVVSDERHDETLPGQR